VKISDVLAADLGLLSSPVTTTRVAALTLIEIDDTSSAAKRGRSNFLFNIFIILSLIEKAARTALFRWFSK
jgi:hypothetical protein